MTDYRSNLPIIKKLMCIILCILSKGNNTIHHAILIEPCKLGSCLASTEHYEHTFIKPSFIYVTLMLC